MSSYSKNIRRKDRAQSELDFFKRMMVETLACTISVGTDDYPLTHVAFFAYDDSSHSISFHFSRHGQAGNAFTDGRKVCISVYKCGKLYTGKTALDFGSEYQSIIVYGTVKMLTEEKDRMKEMRALFDKCFRDVPKDSYKDFSHKDTDPLNIVQVRIDDWLGKEHLLPETATGSFYHPISPYIVY
jgi:nitroimidazol reductase NimA-like FMN-containing flavoprotein (pyridoxamine 5'-phosphate oxidase superfamily)